MSSLAVIPARGGSTRLKDKNIYMLGGKPLINWTIDAVLDSACFDRIIVSSDSDVILDKVYRYYNNVELHRRPDEQATKQAKVLDAMLDILDNNDSKVFGYFLPTCPFRTHEHIKEAFSLLTDNTDTVVSVVPYSEPIQLAGVVNEEDEFIPNTNDLINGNTNSLFMEKHYRPNGGMYMGWSDFIKNNRNFFCGKTKAYIMDKFDSHDINDIFDMKVAEILI